MFRFIVGPLLGVAVLFSFSAEAFDLNGAWTTNAENCGKIFVMKGGATSMTKNSDFFGSGFIVSQDKIRGVTKVCKLTRRKEEAGLLHLIATCTTDIAVLGSQEVSIKIDSDDQVTRLFPSFPELSTSYHRCKF
jgi:hypothetical protein